MSCAVCIHEDYFYLMETNSADPDEMPHDSTFGQIKKISVCSGNGSEILVRVGTHIFFLNYFVFWKKYIILCILKAFCLSKCKKIIFFPENLKKNLGFTSILR